MKREDLVEILDEIIREAQDINIPVPHNIVREVIINKRPKKRFGCCRIKEGNYWIEISEFALSENKAFIRNIIAHELLHTCPDCMNHGMQWKTYATLMNDKYGYNIKRVSKRENSSGENIIEGENIKYIIKCCNCGKEYPRQRFTCVMKKISAYRCQCGGKLVYYSVSEIK